MKTEDQIRTEACDTLGFADGEHSVRQGVGQLTSFNHLGFKNTGKNFKPDGWYLPDDKGQVAIILEVKRESRKCNALAVMEWEREITRNVAVARQKYANVVGILYNPKSRLTRPLFATGHPKPLEEELVPPYRLG